MPACLDLDIESLRFLRAPGQLLPDDLDKMLGRIGYLGAANSAMSSALLIKQRRSPLAFAAAREYCSLPVFSQTLLSNGSSRISWPARSTRLDHSHAARSRP